MWSLLQAPIHRRTQSNDSISCERADEIAYPFDFVGPLLLVSLCNWSDRGLDLGTDFLVGNMVFVWDV